MLIQQTIPKEYNLFTTFIHDATHNGYENRRTKKYHYFPIHVKSITEILNKIMESDKENEFLIKQERVFLKFALKLFNDNLNDIKLEDYAKFMQYSFEAVLERLKNVRKEMSEQIKQKKFEISPVDEEYFFSLENILQQVEIIDKEMKAKKWATRPDKHILLNKVLSVYRNLNELALSIALDDTTAVRSISSSILNMDLIKFNIQEKLIA
jgi:hypothetical protein